MTATTHPEFNQNTEALEVAKAFPDTIRGKTILITGVNRGGIGFTTAQAFASQAPACIIVAGRTPSKLQVSIEELKKDAPNVDYRPLTIDLGNQTSVRKAAEEFLSWDDVPTLDILVNSAGIMNIPERTLSEEGIETHFATNHIGHFLFTNLIMSKLLKAAETNPKGATRVVNVSSGAAERGFMRWSDPTFAKKTKDLPEHERPSEMMLRYSGIKDASDMTYLPTEAYAQSKAANVLFGVGLTTRLYEKHGILSVGLHPGVIQTELGRTTSKAFLDSVADMVKQGIITFRSLEAGASTSLVAATDPKLGPSETKDGVEGWGAYLKDCQISADANPQARSSEQAEKLWKYSEELVGEKFAW